MKYLLALGLSLISIQTWAASASVHWQGTLKAVHMGDSSGKVPLAPLAKVPHLYALGPQAGLQGEITVFDGQFYLSEVEEDQILTRFKPTGKASFLVWSSVKDWGPALSLPAIKHLKALDQALETQAQKQGVSLNEPLAFVLEGQAKEVTYHVLSPPPKQVHAPHKKHPPAHAHKKFAHSKTVKQTPVRFVGFFSKAHAGVFTHHGSHSHIHVIEPGGAGHVDALVLEAGMRLRFPKNP